MHNAGGWNEIIDGISTRLRQSELPLGLVDYTQKALRNVNLEGIASDLAIGGLGFITTLMLVMIYMVFIFAEQAVFRRKILAIAGDHQDAAADVLDTIGRGIQRYLGVKTVVSFLTGSLCYLVLVALEIPYALLFGFLTFLLNYIPTFGSIIAGIFPTITAVADEASWVKAVIVVIVYLSVNLTLGSFIEPRILGRELNLSPLVVVVSVVVWSGLWGVVGGFLAVPLTAGMQICLASSEATLPVAIMLGSGPPRDKRKKRRRADGEEEDDGSSSEEAA
ncbi:MAG: AI-2E family transporter [Planctomycetota bacterium]|nr:AI-2E family transporter [Planctomycetota bacterium]